MSRVRRCDACGKEAKDGRLLEDSTFISVETDDDAGCFDACSWACVAQVAITRAADAGVRP